MDLKQVLRQLGKKTVTGKQAQVLVPPLTVGCDLGHNFNLSHCQGVGLEVGAKGLD